MSKWFDIKAEDMSLSDDGKTLDVNVGYDGDGSIWVSIPIAEIKKIIPAGGKEQG